MYWKLFSYILFDILKLAIIATLSLSLTFSFATAIKPLYEGNLDALMLVRFILFSMPTMLSFVLPFSAGFAVTIVYCRLVVDNEITACLASGISYRALLLPAAMLGLVLTGATFYLSNWVLPDFYGRVATIVERDVTTMLMHRIEEGESVDLPGNVWFYADEGELVEDPAPIAGQTLQPFRRMMLRGVVIGQYGRGRQREATAEAADLYFYREAERTFAEIIYQGAMAYDLDQGHVRSPGTVKYSRIYLPRSFGDHPRFYSWPRLNRLAREPDRFDHVRIKKMRLVDTLAKTSLISHLQASLGEEGTSYAVLESSSRNEVYQIASPDVLRSNNTLHLEADGENAVRLDVMIDGQVHSRIEAQKATVKILRRTTGDTLFRIDRNVTVEEPFAVVAFVRPEVTDLQREAPVVRRSQVDRIGRWSGDLATPLASLSAHELLAHVQRHPDLQASEPCRDGAAELSESMLRLKRLIIAQINRRGAMALSMVLLLVAGALLGLKLGHSLSMVVYFWYFLLATIVLVIITSGATFIVDQANSPRFGIVVSWMGDLLVVIFDVVLYFIVARR